MNASRWLLRLCLVGVASLICPGSGIPAFAKSKEQDIVEEWRRRPMVFFVAKGGPNACGLGCSEWIAAEGKIDPEAGKRLQRFLVSIGHRDLPIFFNSTGGSFSASLDIGSVLRSQRMSVGIGRTAVEGCAEKASDDCWRMLQGKREHEARFVTDGAVCASGCVYAFLGGVERQVAPGARVGVHGSRRAPHAGAISALGKSIPFSVEEEKSWLKAYILSRGVDPALIDLAYGINADALHVLSRDEIARFGISTDARNETAWAIHRFGRPSETPKFRVVKVITEPTLHNRARSAALHIECVGSSDYVITYQREIFRNETVGTVMLRAGQMELPFKESLHTDALSYHRRARMKREFLQRAVVMQQIELVESALSRRQTTARVTNMSAKGLSEQLAQLSNSCIEHKSAPSTLLSRPPDPATLLPPPPDPAPTRL